MAEKALSSSAKCLVLQRSGLYPQPGTTPAHFGCDGRSSAESTAECLNERYKNFLEIAQLGEASVADEQINQILTRFGVRSQPSDEEFLHSTLLVELGTAMLIDRFELTRAQDHPEEYAYLFLPNAVGQVHIHYINAVLYLLCVQKFPKHKPVYSDDAQVLVMR